MGKFSVTAATIERTSIQRIKKTSNRNNSNIMYKMNIESSLLCASKQAPSVKFNAAYLDKDLIMIVIIII